MRLLLVMCLFLPVTVAVGQTSDRLLITKVFDQYKSAIINDQGKKAVAVIDASTRNYYIQILGSIKTADSATIESLTLVDKITILAVRAKATKEEIIAIKDVDAFVYSIDEGLAGKGSVSNNRLGKITITGTTAKAQAVTAGKPIPLYFTFNKENGSWKMNLTDLFAIANDGFKELIKDSGMPEQEFLLLVLSDMTGMEQTMELWKPVL